MKKFLIMAIVFLFSLMSGCGVNLGYETGKVDGFADDTLGITKRQVGYIEIDEDTFYVLEMQCHTLNSEQNQYYFGGVKYSDDTSYIDMYNLNEHYRIEIDYIQNYLKLHQFESEINEKDILDFESKILEKEDFLKLFNITINSPGYSRYDIENGEFIGYESIIKN